VELCNVLGANPWVNMPHAADDGYVTSFANYVKNNLRPDLKVGTWHTAKETEKIIHSKASLYWKTVVTSIANYVKNNLRPDLKVVSYIRHTAKETE
jgi:hypothetical protein